jgi:hypothetical protein
MIKCEVKQGNSLSTTLFSLVIDTILKQIELRGIITTRLKQCTAYADNILLTTRTKQSLLDTFQKLKETLAQYWLIVNGQKTKYFRCTRKNNILEEVQIKSKYLGFCVETAFYNGLLKERYKGNRSDRKTRKKT